MLQSNTLTKAEGYVNMALLAELPENDIYKMVKSRRSSRMWKRQRKSTITT
jgi:hypothetical protein